MTGRALRASMAIAGVVGINVLIIATLLPLSITGAGSVSPDSLPGGSFVRMEPDPEVSSEPASRYLYCQSPAGERFHGVSLRNESLLPVTILGVVPVATVGGDGRFGVAELRTFSDGAGGYLDPRTAPVLPASELAPGGAALPTWVGFASGEGVQLVRGGYMATNALTLRVAVLGLERTVEVVLPYSFGVTPDCVD